MLECDFRLEKVPELQMLVPFFRIFMQTVPRYRLWKVSGCECPVFHQR